MNKRFRYGLIVAGLAAVATITSVFAFSSKAPSEDKWSQVDTFKAGLNTAFKASGGAAPGFDVVRMGRELSAFRVDGMPVCAQEEITADQYIELSDLATRLAGYPGFTPQLNSVLDTPNGLTDCQFRVIQSAAR